MKASKPLRKALALLVMCSLAAACFALCACGESSNATASKQDRFEGCWRMTSVEQGGKTLDSDDVEKAYQKNGFIYLLELESGGKGSFDAYNQEAIHEDVTWESTGTDKLTIKFKDSVGLAEMSGDKLELEEGGMTFCFTKIDKTEYDELCKNLGSKGSSSSSSSSSASTSSDGVNPEFKKQMDDYEAFFDEYVAFMKQYKANPSNMELLSKASSIMSKYSTMMNDFNKIKNQSLSTADAAYYSEVSNRILKKLSEVA